MTINYKFDMLSEIFHITPESPKGYIIARKAVTDPYLHIMYEVSFGWSADDTVWCGEDELTNERAII